MGPFFFGISRIMPIKARQLRQSDREGITRTLNALKGELAELRVAKVTGSSSKAARIGSVRKQIARVLTVMSEKTRESVRKAYAGKKYQPLDLRAKKTRAIRQRLNKHEANRMTVKQLKKKTHFSQRKY